jgi:hypothetical protein
MNYPMRINKNEDNCLDFYFCELFSVLESMARAIPRHPHGLRAIFEN